MRSADSLDDLRAWAVLMVPLDTRGFGKSSELTMDLALSDAA